MVKMNNNELFLQVVLNTLLFVVPGGCYRIPTLPDNCTCVTSEGIYSLFPLRRTDGKPRFTKSGFQPHPGYIYSYNPCVPYTFTSRKGVCKDVALCKYNDDDQPVYTDIGEQRNVECEIDGEKIALIYPINNPEVPTHESRVNLECETNPKADIFALADEDKMIFNLTSHCGCPNQCQSPTTTTPKPDWELKILLPSLLGPLVVVIFFVCLWMRLSVIQRARVCRCCQCYEPNRDPPREERFVPVTEKSPLISNHENDRAVEHEHLGVKGKLNEPVQEDGDVKGENGLPGKDYRAVVT